jgi:uncharacterized protein YggE
MRIPHRASKTSQPDSPKETVMPRVALALAIALLAALPAAAQDKVPSTLTVLGEGTAAGRPDLATVSVGVVTQARSASDALALNSKAAGEVIALAKQSGVEPRDIQTSAISVQPQYNPPAPGAREPARIVGYQVRNSLSVRVRDIDKLGGLLDKLVTGGANQLGGILLSVAEPKPLLDQARAAAVRDAMAKAQLYAEAAGVRIVRILAIDEAGAEPPRPIARLAAAAPRPSVPIEAGEQEFRARVSATFEIAPK